MGHALPPALTLDGSTQLPNGTATERIWYAVEPEISAGVPFLSMASLPTVSMALLLRSAVMVPNSRRVPDPTGIARQPFQRRDQPL
jgi:hypothetical protein